MEFWLSREARVLGTEVDETTGFGSERQEFEFSLDLCFAGTCSLTVKASNRPHVISMEQIPMRRPTIIPNLGWSLTVTEVNPENRCVRVRLQTRLNLELMRGECPMTDRR